MNNVDNSIINAISLCSGVGMLDEGIHAGLEYLGIRSRTLMYAEREAYPVSVLAARMEEGSISPAPIWFGDFTELQPRKFRGMVDIVISGFPCQDLSVAGKRVGLDGRRSGLFFEVVRVATDSGAWGIVLENVAGIASATASVMDETEGALDERAAARVVGELADLGWDAEWITLSASDVGASHGRARWFCFAWRLANSESFRGIFRKRDELSRGTKIEGSINSMGDSQSIRPNWTPNEQRRTALLGRTSEYVADASSAGLSQRVGGGGICERPAESDQGANLELHSCLLFAPGPSDTRWPGLIARFPWLAPALESTFRGVVNGLAFDMGDCRAARVKCVGNGVVPLCAATAFVLLALRSGIFEGMK